METRSFDRTLPLDFDGSSNMVDLPDVTLGDVLSTSHSETASRTCQTNSSSNSVLPLPHGWAVGNSGRLSPVLGRTMKEYDQQISDLNKENFSLKLRVYSLEEQMRHKYGDGEDVVRTNIELRVMVEGLKAEMDDKQDLLRKASMAMETITANQRSDLDNMRQTADAEHQKCEDELRADLHKALQDAEDARDEVDAVKRSMHNIELRLQQSELDHSQAVLAIQNLKDSMVMKNRDLSELHSKFELGVTRLEDAKRMQSEGVVQQESLEHMVEKLRRDLDRRGRDVDRLSCILNDTTSIDSKSLLVPTHLQDTVLDQKGDLEHMSNKLAEQEDQLRDKDNTIKRVEERLRELEKKCKQANNEVERLNAELEGKKRLDERFCTTIQGLMSKVYKEDKKLADAKSKVSKSETELTTLQAELLESRQFSDHQVRQLEAQVAESEVNCRRLQHQVDDGRDRMELAIKSLGVKEGELVHYSEQLEAANQAVRRSEEALEGLQEQLKQERSDALSRFDRQAQDYQCTVIDYRRQLEALQRQMSGVTDLLLSKDRQISSLMDLFINADNPVEKSSLQRLHDAINVSNADFQLALKSKQDEVNRMSQELLETQLTVQNMGRELDNVKQQLLDHNRGVEKLELGDRQQSDAGRELSSMLTETRKAFEEKLTCCRDVLQEKDEIIGRLQTSLVEKENTVKEITKEASVVNVDPELWEQLNGKDIQLQRLGAKHQKDLLNHERELQQLSVALLRKDCELRALGARSAEVEREHLVTVQSLHGLMADKDRTLQTLLDDAEMKERQLFSSLNLIKDAKSRQVNSRKQSSETANLNQQVLEKQNQNGGGGGQFARPQHGDEGGSVPSDHCCDGTFRLGALDSAQVCQLLEEHLYETKALNELLRLRQLELSDILKLAGRSEHCQVETQALRSELLAVSDLHKLLQEEFYRNQFLHHSLLNCSLYNQHANGSAIGNKFEEESATFEEKLSGKFPSSVAGEFTEYCHADIITDMKLEIERLKVSNERLKAQVFPDNGAIDPPAVMPGFTSHNGDGLLDDFPADAGLTVEGFNGSGLRHVPPIIPEMENCWQVGGEGVRRGGVTDLSEDDRRSLGTATNAQLSENQQTDDFCEPVLGTADHSLGMADHSAISVFHSSGSSTNLSAVAMSSASNAGTSDTCQAGGYGHSDGRTSELLSLVNIIDRPSLPATDSTERSPIHGTQSMNERSSDEMLVRTGKRMNVSKHSEDGGSNMYQSDSVDWPVGEVLRHDIAKVEDLPDIASAGTGKQAYGESMTTQSDIFDWSIDDHFSMAFPDKCASAKPVVRELSTEPGHAADVTINNRNVTYDKGNVTYDRGNVTYASFSESIIHLASHSLVPAKSDNTMDDADGNGGLDDDSSLLPHHISLPFTGNAPVGRDGTEGSAAADVDIVRLNLLVDMNRTLREELGVFESLCRSKGIQVSEEDASVESGDAELRLLQLHLTELRRLREQLERVYNEACDVSGAGDLTNVVVAEYLQRIADLEHRLLLAKEEVSRQQALAGRRLETIDQCQRTVAECQPALERHQKEAELMSADMAVLQQCLAQRNADVFDLRRQVETLDKEVVNAGRVAEAVKDDSVKAQHESDLRHVRCSELERCLHEVESQLSEANNRVAVAEKRVVCWEERGECLEKSLFQIRGQCKELRSRLENEEKRRLAMEDEGKKKELALHADLSEAQQQCLELRAELDDVEKKRFELEDGMKRSVMVLNDDLSATRDRCRELQSALDEEGRKSLDVHEKMKVKVVTLKTEMSCTKQQCDALRMALGDEANRRQDAEKQMSCRVSSLKAEVSELLVKEDKLSSVISSVRSQRDELSSEVAAMSAERDCLRKHAAEIAAMLKESRESEQQLLHFKDRALGAEMRVHKLHDKLRGCEGQLRSQEEEREACERGAGERVRQAAVQVERLQAELREAQSRAATNESLAQRARTLVSTLEGRLRELEAKIKDSEDRVRDSEYDLQSSQDTVSQLRADLESLSGKLAERCAKLAKRDVQLSNLVPEYKRLYSAHKGCLQIIETLKTEVCLHESMTCQTDLSCDKKEELMKQLLAELSHTRRLAEGVIKHIKQAAPSAHQTLTAATAVVNAGSVEAADGSPTPHPIGGCELALGVPGDEAKSGDVMRRSEVSCSSSICSASITDESECLALDVNTKPNAGSVPVSHAASQDRTSSQGSLTLPSLAVGVGLSVRNAGDEESAERSFVEDLQRFPDLSNKETSTGDKEPLFAVGQLGDYECLRMESRQWHRILASVQICISDHLDAISKDVCSEITFEHAALGDVSMNVHSLIASATEVERLISTFRVMSLPAVDSDGGFVRYMQLSEENTGLRGELSRCRTEYEALVSSVREQQERLHATNTLRKKWETTLYQKLSPTKVTLTRCKENVNLDDCSPFRKRSPQKSPTLPVKEKN